MDIPRTELKLVFDSARALQGDYSITDELRNYFNFGKPRHMKIWFLDTIDQQLKNLGWIIRFRYHEGFDFELTYKKRFSESEFKAIPIKTLYSLNSFKPEIDMNITKKTYSFSKEKTVPASDYLYGLQLSEARRLAILLSPAVFTNLSGINGGFKLLCVSSLYGPVSAVEYKGTYNGIEASLEVWKLGDFLTELSFKIETKDSEVLLNRLLSEPIIKRLVIPEGKLKTEALFEYYSEYKELIYSG